MKYYIFLSVLALAALAVLAASPATANIIYATQDAFINQTQPDTVQGAGITVKGQSSYRRIGFLEYAFGDIAVTEATLHMYHVAKWSDPTYRVDFRGGEATWDESAITWNTGVPEGSGQWPVIGQWTAGAAGLWYTLDITDFYNDNLGKSMTFRLSSPDGGANQGGSYEDRLGGRGSGNPHYISFTPVPEPSSLLALASGFVGLAGVAIRRRR